MFLKCPLYSCKAGKCWNQHVFTNLQKRCQILILTLWYLTLPYFLAKIAQILQKVIVFFLQRGEEIEPWFSHIWIAQWLKFFSTILLIFLDFGHLQGETRGQSWTKSANLGSVSFSLILQFLSNNVFLFYWAIFRPTETYHDYVSSWECKPNTS